MLSFTCSAVDDGYQYDEEGDFYYQTLPSDEEAATTEETTIKRNGPLRAAAASGSGSTIAYPDFDMNKIDVAGFPDYVKSIIASPSSFTFVIVFSSTFYVYVADGCLPGIASSTGNLFIINTSFSSPSLATGITSQGFNPSCYACFVGHYSWSASDDLYDDYYNGDSWKIPTTKNVNRDGDNGFLFTYPIPSSLAKKTSDFYCFGRVVYRSGIGDTGFNFPLASGSWMWFTPGNFSDIVSRYNAIFVRSSSGDSNFRFIDGGSFPTVESQQAETQRGILGQLKALPVKIKGFFTSLGDRISGFFDNLFDKIKGLFIPSDGFFDTYFSDLKTFFAERFGFLYDLPAAAVTIFNQLVSFKPAESGYHIHFPEVSAPVIMEGISGVGWQRIIPEQDYYFDFLDKAPFSTLYSGYRAFIWLAYCFMLVNLAKNKADSILGGK